MTERKQEIINNLREKVKELTELRWSLTGKLAVAERRVKELEKLLEGGKKNLPARDRGNLPSQRRTIK